MRSAVIAASIVTAGCGRIHFDNGTNTARGDGSVTDGSLADFDALAAANVAFVSSMAQRPGSLGGVVGADSLCNTLATDAGLPGTYRAWLSTAAEAAPDRLAGARGWIRSDGRPFVDTIADLLASRAWYPIDLDELGFAVRTTSAAGVSVVTGTNVDGTYGGQDCGGYMQIGPESPKTGRADFTTNHWTEGIFGRCDQAARIYCFGVTRTNPVAPQAELVRRAFLSSTLFVHDGGLAGADSLCQSDANAATLPGTFRALLATSTASALARFDTTGAPWARPDGTLIAATAADFSAGRFLAPINQAAAGTYISNAQATTGASAPDVIGSASTTCMNWTRGSSSATRLIGTVNSVNVYSTIQTNCSQPAPLYCLEQ